MVTLSFTIFSGQKNYNRAHMLFQVLCGFEPIFYTTHPNEEPFYLSNQELRGKIARKGRERVLTEHNMVDKIRYMMDVAEV